MKKGHNSYSILCKHQCTPEMFKKTHGNIVLFIDCDHDKQPERSKREDHESGCGALNITEM